MYNANTPKQYHTKKKRYHKDFEDWVWRQLEINLSVYISENSSKEVFEDNVLSELLHKEYRFSGEISASLYVRLSVFETFRHVCSWKPE